MWKDKFKIAVIHKDIENIDKLLKNIPEFENIDEMREVQYLIKEATSLLQNLKTKTATTIKSIENNLSFLQSSESHKISKIDIRS